MLKEHSFDYTYRDYTKEPLTRPEIEEVLDTLGMSVGEMLRSRDAKKVGLPSDASDDAVLDAMAENNRLLQRPILVTDKGARMGRPAEVLLEVM